MAITPTLSVYGLPSTAGAVGGGFGVTGSLYASQMTVSGSVGRDAITGLVVDGGQSNDVGAGSYIINVPANHNRHGDAVALYDINGLIVPATESLSLNIDPFITANPDLGFGAQKVASNDYVDAFPSARLLHVPNGYSGSSLESEWAVPNGPETVRMVSRIRAAVAATGCTNAVLLWSQGENSTGTTWASLTQTLWNYVQSASGVTFSFILYCQLSATPPFGYTQEQAANWQAVRVAQTTLQTSKQFMIVVPDIGGYLHQNSDGQQVIGHAYGALLVANWRA